MMISRVGVGNGVGDLFGEVHPDASTELFEFGNVQTVFVAFLKERQGAFDVAAALETHPQPPVQHVTPVVTIAKVRKIGADQLGTKTRTIRL